MPDPSGKRRAFAPVRGLMMAAGLIGLSLLLAHPARAGCMKEDADGPYFEGNAALCPGGQTAPAARDHFTSIAVSSSNGDWGDSWLASSRAAADRTALANCGKRVRDCKVEMWAENGCIALAEGTDNSWGVGWGPNPGAAETQALQQCRNATKATCTIKGHPCSEDPP